MFGLATDLHLNVTGVVDRSFGIDYVCVCPSLDEDIVMTEFFRQPSAMLHVVSPGFLGEWPS